MESVEYFSHGHDALHCVVNSGNQLLVFVVLSWYPATTQAGVEGVLPVHCIRWVILVRKGELTLGKFQDLRL